MTTRKAKTPVVSAAQKELDKNKFPTHVIMGYSDEEDASNADYWAKVNDATYSSPDYDLESSIKDSVDSGDKYIVVYAPVKIIKVFTSIKETLV